jgi:hypothetical protein
LQPRLGDDLPGRVVKDCAGNRGPKVIGESEKNCEGEEENNTPTVVQLEEEIVHNHFRTVKEPQNGLERRNGHCLKESEIECNVTVRCEDGPKKEIHTCIYRIGVV